MQQIILASQSPQRKSIVATFGLPFKVIPANIDEQAVTGKTFEERACNIAVAKAEFVHSLHHDAVIIAGDTFGVADGRVLEKPTTLEQAEEMLFFLSGKTVSSLSGFCYIDPVARIIVKQTVRSDGKFRQLTTAEIKRYVAENPVLTWSAGFSAAYPAGASLIATVNGSLTSFTHGLPAELLADCFEKSRIKL